MGGVDFTGIYMLFSFNKCLIVAAKHVSPRGETFEGPGDAYICGFTSGLRTEDTVLASAYNDILRYLLFIAYFCL